MDSFPLFGTSLLGSMSSFHCCFLTCRNTGSSFFFFFKFPNLSEKRERQREDRWRDGRADRQAGRQEKQRKKERKKERKNENNERSYRSTCCFPDTKGKTKDRKGHE